MILFQIIPNLLLTFLQLSLAELSGNLTNVICLVLILIFGIPHGAVDHKVHLSTHKASSFKVFIFKYLLIIGGYTVIWLLFPRIALVTFLLTATYHFGQEALENQKTKESFWLSMVLGIFIVFAPLLFHYSEAKAFLDIIAPDFFPILSEQTSTLISGFIVLLTMGVMVLLRMIKWLGRAQFLNLLLFAGILVAINLVFNFLVAFTIYFIFFHSLNAFKHQYTWLAQNKEGYTLKSFIKDLLGFSLLAIFGLVFLLWVLGAQTSNQLVSYFFILTSIITLPHAITLDQFYKIKKSKTISLAQNRVESI